MKLWRLTPQKTKAIAFNGEGSKAYGGRWNPKGLGCIYTSSTTSLSLLESLVHFDLDTAPVLYLYSVEVENPQTIDLPTDWQTNDVATREAGKIWLEANLTLTLQVPSVIVPHENNFVLNPRHSDFTALVITEHGVFDPDKRLLG